MDKVMKITLVVFVGILVIFTGTLLYNAYVEREYRGSLVSAYSYSLTIITSEDLNNATIFIPVPVNPGGNSPFVEQFSIRGFSDMPPDWETTLLGSDKSTMIKIHAPVVRGGSGAGSGLALSAEARTGRVIGTKSPQEKDIVLRPVQNLKETSCDGFAEPLPGAICYHYESAVYADYTSTANAKVEISSTVAGKNAWNVFGAKSNQYTNTISTLIHGENHGWVVTKGELQAGSGSYNAPALSQ